MHICRLHPVCTDIEKKMLYSTVWDGDRGMKLRGRNSSVVIKRGIVHVWTFDVVNTKLHCKTNTYTFKQEKSLYVLYVWNNLSSKAFLWSLHVRKKKIEPNKTNVSPRPPDSPLSSSPGDSRQPFIHATIYYMHMHHPRPSSESGQDLPHWGGPSIDAHSTGDYVATYLTPAH